MKKSVWSALNLTQEFCPITLHVHYKGPSPFQMFSALSQMYMWNKSHGYVKHYIWFQVMAAEFTYISLISRGLSSRLPVFFKGPRLHKCFLWALSLNIYCMCNKANGFVKRFIWCIAGTVSNQGHLVLVFTHLKEAETWPPSFNWNLKKWGKCFGAHCRLAFRTPESLQL